MTIENLAIKIIETPGHSFDHVSILIGRDFFIGDLVTNPNPIIAMKEEDSKEVISSLKKILKFEFDKAYSGLGVWDRSEVKNTLENTLRLKGKVEALRRKGLSIDQIVERIFPNPPKKVIQMEEVSGGEWSRKNLVESLLGVRYKAN